MHVYILIMSLLREQQNRIELPLINIITTYHFISPIFMFRFVKYNEWIRKIINNNPGYMIHQQVNPAFNFNSFE